VAELVILVRLVRVPSQVLDPVVRRFAVVVAADQTGRARTDERLQDEAMDIPGDLPGNPSIVRKWSSITRYVGAIPPFPAPRRSSRGWKEWTLAVPHLQPE
jgi:hypothetical protein